MISFQVVETFSAAPVNVISGICDLELVVQGGKTLLYTATRAGGGVLALEVGASMTLLDQESIAPGTSLPAEATLETVVINGTTHLIVTGANQAGVNAFGITATGTLNSPIQLPGSLSGAIAAQSVLQIGATTFFYAARMGESTIHTYSVAANGTMTLVGSRVLDGPHTGVDITALMPVTVAGQRFMVSLSLEADVLRAFPVNANGTLGNPTMIGAPQGLGIADPAAVRAVEMGGTTFLILGSTISSSVSVISLSANGSMSVTDHVIDTLDTRFQGVQALATVQLGDRVFVITGGGDDGLTVMTLMPDGRLVACGQLLGGPGVPIDNITALTARVTGGQIELFIATEGTGITRLLIDPGTLAPIQTGGLANATLTGGADADMIIGGDGVEQILGGLGNDILADGAGADTLFGGAGADLFVIGADGEVDRIADYQFGIDRIDLSAWGPIHSLAALTITATATGALITRGDETLELVTPNGMPLSPNNFQLSDFIGLWHAPPPAPEPANLIYGTNQIDFLTGGTGDDMFLVSFGADTINGGAGFDTILLSGATAAVRISLEAQNQNTNIATGQTYISIEGMIGSAFSDNLTGSSEANRIEGLDGNDRLSGSGGNDTLIGGNGNDTLLGGLGADVLDGGIGRDRASYRESLFNVVADLMTPALNAGEAAGDSYTGIEDLEATGYNDTIAGDAQANNLVALEGNDRLDGRSGNDSLFGGEGNDTLVGGEGADRLEGGNGTDWASYDTAAAAVRIDLVTPSLNTGDVVGDSFISIEGYILSGFADTFSGSAGADLANGGAGNDTLSGLAGADWLAGGAGNDTLYGGDGDDTLMGGLGIDRLEGGAGVDLVTYSAATAGLWVDFAVPTMNTGEAQGDVFVAVEDIEGSAFADTVAGDAGANRLYGLAGNDLILGRGGNDLLQGGDGDDTLMGGPGVDTLTGGAGFDIASYAESTALRVDLATPGLSTGEALGDVFSGIEGLLGGTGADTLQGDGIANLLTGGLGNDSLDGRAGDDTLQGGDGLDTLLGGDGNDRLDGGLGNDWLEGGAGNDILLAGDGNDTLLGGTGADQIDGGAGTDIASYAGATEGLVLNLGQQGLNAGAALGDVLTGIEEVIGTGLADAMTGDGLANILRGELGADWLSGGAGNDTLYGGDGDDTLIGGLGSDRLEGGAGIDLVTYAAATAGLWVDLTTPALNTGEALGDVLVAVENLEGSAFADTLAGDAGANFLAGLAGNDQLSGRAGNDTLLGGDGDDTLMGGLGSDTLTGGAGFDIASYAESTALRVDLATPGLSTGEALGDVFDGIEGLLGGTGADTLQGDGFANLLTGGLGNDSLDGRAGDDTLQGGDGLDTLLGGDGNDRLDGGNDADRLEGGAGTDSLIGGAGNDLLYGDTEFDTLEGGLGLDTLFGGDGSDRLDGGNDADRLEGGAGTDTLIGGDGNDLLYGDTEFDTLEGGLGNDTLFGGDGDDRLDGGTGTDRMEGGLGNDLYLVDSALDVLVEALSAGTDTVETALTSYTLAANFEILLLRSAANSIGTGNALNNTLAAGAGADTLLGLGGVDWLYGDAGNDSLDGGAETDALWGGPGDDILLGGDGGDALQGEVGNDLLYGGNGIDWLYGGDNDDRLEGGADTDALFGSFGNDLLYGDAGDDNLDGGYGADALYGGQGVDWLYGSFDADSLFGGSETDALFGQEGNDTLDGGDGGDNLDGGAEDDSLSGGAGDDWLYGQGGQDTLDGGDNDDVLWGGIGSDRLTGGAGGDHLDGGDGDDWLTGGTGRDVYHGGAGVDHFQIITRDAEDLFLDFTSGTDRVVLDRAALGIAMGSTLAGMWQSGAGLPGSFGGTGAVLFYDTTFRALFLDTDGGSSANATALFSLDEGLTLALSDLLLV